MLKRQYTQPSPRAVSAEVLLYAGFTRVEPQEPYRAPLTDGRTGMMHRALIAYP